MTLEAISSEGPVPAECKAAYIGVFEDQSGQYVIHFLGSVDFDAEDDDWACETDQDWIPEHRYLQSGVSSTVGWMQFLAGLEEAVRQIAAKKGTLLSDISHVAVGFDGGDLILV